ncbi:MAG: type II toxin-antitoxin system PemK/MazF family toxin, partial [Vicinamibacteria bacterium]
TLRGIRVARASSAARTKEEAPVTAPARGDVWLAEIDPTRGHEQAGRRPALVLSDDVFNRGPASLVIVLPITSTLRPIPSHVRLAPPDGGLKAESTVLCEAIRSVSRERLIHRIGSVSNLRMALVEDAVRVLLRL